MNAREKTVSRFRDDSCGESAGKWLLTFNDMITLLLAFFVLIISMSMIEKTKIVGVADSAKRAAGKERSPDEADKKENVGSITPSLEDRDIVGARQQRDKGESDDPFAARRTALAGMLASLEGVETIPGKNGLSLSMNERFLFSPGSAEISDQGQKVLKAISQILGRADVSVCVEGHTDSTPIHSDKYPSNWELSTARAVKVVRWLGEKGGIAQERLSAVGYGAARPRASNDSEQNRRINRRVDLVLTFLKL
jgi:chemotaxis protein MotB